MNKNKPKLSQRSAWFMKASAGLWFFCCGCVTPAVHKFDARLTMVAGLQIEGPCIASVVGPPPQNCIQWQPNVDASATYEPSRRLFFAGASDNFLHVVDADNGRAVAQIATVGRVITDTFFSKDSSLMYVGTEKGVLHAFDAYTFARVFTVHADSKINNDAVFVLDQIIFTTALGSLYAVDKNKGEVRWHNPAPQKSSERLRLSHQSNIVVLENTSKSEEVLLVVPQADGLVSIVSARYGTIKRQVQLAPKAINGFPDIVAPMVWFKNRLWVASYGVGVFGLDVTNGKVTDEIAIKEVVSLISDGVSLFAASMDTLYAITGSSAIAWKNPISQVVSRNAALGYPFQHMQGAKRLFYGLPSRPLLSSNHLIIATSSGSLGFFDKATGHLDKLVGNSVGFGPKIGWAGATNLVAVSRRGLLMKFQIFDPTRLSHLD